MRSRLDAEANAAECRRRKEAEAEENAAIEADIARHEEEIRAREAAKEEARRRKEEELAMARAAVESSQTSAREEADAFNELIARLRFEEYEEACRQKEASDRELASRRREEQRAEYELAVQRREEARARTEEEKKRFSERLQRELAEQDRVEQMNAQRRRMKLLEHSREVRRLADEKFAAKEAALEMERRELEARRREREAVDAAIESERAKMLQEFESRRG